MAAIGGPASAPASPAAVPAIAQGALPTSAPRPPGPVARCLRRYPKAPKTNAAREAARARGAGCSAGAKAGGACAEPGAVGGPGVRPRLRSAPGPALGAAPRRAGLCHEALRAGAGSGRALWVGASRGAGARHKAPGGSAVRKPQAARTRAATAAAAQARAVRAPPQGPGRGIRDWVSILRCLWGQGTGGDADGGIPSAVGATCYSSNSNFWGPLLFGYDGLLELVSVH